MMGSPCKPAFERVFHSLVSLLLLEGVVPPGVLLDAGAFDGVTACALARAAPSRVVHAIEFLPQNVATIRERYAAVPNLAVHHGGLGEHDSNVTIPRGTPRMQRKGWQMDANWLRRRAPHASHAAQAPRPGDSVTRIQRVDDLFATAGLFGGESLAFAHWDVEGSELSVLRGARRTLRRDWPLFSMEVHVLADRSYTQRLLAEIDTLGYDAYIIDEVCGSRVDCRNLLCFPRSRGRIASHALDLAVAGGRLAGVINNATSLADRLRRHADALVVPRALNNYGEASAAFEDRHIGGIDTQGPAPPATAAAAAAAAAEVGAATPEKAAGSRNFGRRLRGRRLRLKLSERRHRNCTVAPMNILAELPSAALSSAAPAAAPAPVPTTGILTPPAPALAPSRTIWMWWAQGWARAPPIVRACAHSWAHANPRWRLRRLEAADVYATAALATAMASYAHLPEVSHALYADVLRTELLGLYGGLWVDATIFCIKPIEEWLPTSVIGVDHSGDRSRGGRVVVGGGRGRGVGGGSGGGDGADGFFALRYEVNGAGEVLNSLLYAREPRHPMVQQMRFNFRLFWATPHTISTWNVFEPDYFAYGCQRLTQCLDLLCVQCSVECSTSAGHSYWCVPPLPAAGGCSSSAA